MCYHIIIIATPSIYLTLSFQGGQRSSQLLLQFFLLEAWDQLRMAEGFLVIRRAKGSTERSMQKSQSSEVAIKANRLGSRADRQKPIHWKSIQQRTDSHKAVRQRLKLTLRESAAAILPPGCGHKEQIDIGGQAGTKTWAEDRAQDWGVSDKWKSQRSAHQSKSTHSQKKPQASQDTISSARQWILHLVNRSFNKMVFIQLVWGSCGGPSCSTVSSQELCL